MKDIFILFVICGVFSFCYGQNIGGQGGGGEIVWNDDINLDEIGSAPMISVSSDIPSYPVHIVVLEGSGGGVGDSTKAAVQGESGLWSTGVSYSGDQFIPGGKSFSISCTLTQFDQLKWTLNGSPVKFPNNGYTVKEIPAPQGFIGSRLNVAKSRKDHAGDYKCTTFSPLSHTIYILSGQTGSSDSTKVISRIGFPSELECKITHDVGAPMEVKWYKNNEVIHADVMVNEKKHYKFKDNTTLVIQNATKEDIGDYKCQTEGFTPQKSFNVSVIYLKYRTLPKSTMVLESDKMNLTCDVEGEPMPSITWFKDNKNIEEALNSSRFSLVTNMKGTEKSSLIIDKAEYIDRAEYTCVISVKDVQYNTTTFVRVKDMYAALWPFLGICAEVFILCLIIFIYEKRRAKADFEESDTDQPPEQKNTSELNKDCIRQRK